MTVALRLLALLASAALLAACGDDDAAVDAGGGSPGGASAALAEEYLSLEVTEAGETRALVDGTAISLRFDDGQLGASLGCNMLGARYELDGDRLVVGELSSTEMGCDPERHAQDEWFADLLGSEPTLVVDGDVLTLTSGETVVRLVDRRVAEPDRALVGTTWEVDGFADGQEPEDSAMSMAVEQPGIVRLEENGFVTGSDGCNSFGFSQTEGEGTDGLRHDVEGDRVTFTGDAPSTLVACPDLEEYTDRFWSALTGTATWSIDGDRLALVGEDGRVVTFRAVD